MADLIINKKIKDCVTNISLTANMYPGAVIIHDLRDWSVVWMSERGLKEINATAAEIEGMSSKVYHERYFNPEDAGDYVPKIMGMMDRNLGEEIVTYFQQVRVSQNSEWTWHMSSTRILLWDDHGKPLLSITASFPIDAMHHMASKASRLLEENNFLRRNFKQYAKLSHREREVLRLLAVGQTSADTAQQLFITVNTVETHRKNIRQKLEVNTFFELTQYARAFDLI